MRKAVKLADCAYCKKPIKSYRDYYHNGGKPLHIKCSNKKAL